jgi:hypothetical protein
MKKLVLFMAVIFAVTFVNAQTKTEIKVADLQKVITDHITANYAGYTIEKAFKVDEKGVITYKVHVAKAADKLTLVYDKNGKFEKKVVSEQKKPATTEPKPKTTEKAPATAPAKTTK